MVYFKILGRESCPWCCRACGVLKEGKINFMFCEMGSSPELIAFYNKYHQSKNFEVVFISADRNIDGYLDYYNKMPWLKVSSIWSCACRANCIFNNININRFIFEKSYTSSLFHLDVKFFWINFHFWNWLFCKV